ncbi:MAG: PAS domain S-box protein [Thermodesulfobacteriota bacterium]
MNIRSFIFIGVIALGLLPLFFVVGLNLPRTIERLEYAAGLEAQARSHVDFTRINARIRCLKKSLIRSATLPSTIETINRNFDSSILTTVFQRWFNYDDQVSSLFLFDHKGEPQLSLTRGKNGLETGQMVSHITTASFFKQTLALEENMIFAELVDEKQDPFGLTRGKDSYTLLMASPVISSTQQTLGVVVLSIELSAFLENFKDGFWVTDSGSFLRGCELIKDDLPDDVELTDENCNAYTEFPGLEFEDNPSDPVILVGKDDNKIAWLPLVFNAEHRAVMWVGYKVDVSAIESWKVNLTVNVIVVIFSMSVFVFLSANWIAKRIDAMKGDLLTGLDDIINNEKRAVFHWKGPREIKNMAGELTALADRYIETCEARNLAEEWLKESEDKFRNLTASALDGIILMDHEGNIAYWNEAASIIFGYESEEALGRPIHVLIGPRREGVSDELLTIQKGDREGSLAQTVELVALSKAGGEVNVELSLSSTRIKDQWHAIWIVRDITERKKSEERARQQQLHLQHADKMISLGLLVSGVAHEINNPNSIALLNLPILKRSWESAKPILDEFFEENGDFAMGGIEYTEIRRKLPQVFTELEESAQRIKEIVVDLKDYARQETSGLMDEVDINDVVRSGVRLTSNAIHKSTNHFRVEYGQDIPMVLGNRQRLIQVVINLIQNSCESLEDSNRTICVMTRYNQESDGVEVSVQDEGGGIASDVINKVTDPFFTTKRTMGGTGLGLAVSAGIVKEHNGLITFTSELGVGTEAIVSLPARQEAEV